MPVSRLASESDIQGTDMGTDILTTAAATLIRTTGTTDRTTMVGRHFIGTAVIAFIIRECIGDIIGIGTKPGRGQALSQPAGAKIPSALFFWRA